MDSIPLTWDPKNGHFWAEVGVALGDESRRASETFGHFSVEKLIVDTGSNRSGIAEIVAETIGIDVSKLPRADVHGISGAVSHPMAEHIVFWFMAGEPRPVQLPRVLVIPRTRRRVAKKKPGRYAFRGKPYGPSISILGLDAVEALEARLEIDMKAKRGQIRW